MAAVITDTRAGQPAPFGLLSPATTVIKDSSPHWTDEFDYETLDCVAQVDLVSICNSTTSVSAVQSSGTSLFRTYVPFEILTSFKCSTMGRTPAEIEKIARDNAESCAQKALEFELWTGSLAKAAAADGSWNAGERGAFPNRFLASDSAVDVTPTPGTGVKAKYGLALLERALADCGCGIQGTIHATRDVASALGVKGKENTLFTNLGNHIVAGTGYTGTGPDGTDPGSGKAWMYATGPVSVRLGDIMVVPDKPSQAVDIRVNTTKYTASQPAAVTWNSCCHAAVLIDLDLDYS